jgi:hypothetical protein
MATLQDIQKQVHGLFKKSSFKEEADFQARGIEAPIETHFSHFDTESQAEAKKIYEKFFALENSKQSKQEVLQKVVNLYKKLRGTENADKLHYALMVFLTHSEFARGIRIPSILTREPHKVIPSTFTTKLDRGIEEESNIGGATSPEDLLNWFREDVILNEHHGHWHIVFPTGGIGEDKKLLDRQGELFVYMHHQMLARYDSERIIAGLPRLIPFAINNERKDFSISSGYNPGEVLSKSYLARPQGKPVSDAFRTVKDGNVVVRVTLEQQQQYGTNWQPAMETGYFSINGKKLQVEANSVGTTIEANKDSVDTKRETYGNYHNMGHMLSASIDWDSKNPNLYGVMSDTVTAIRDPFFYEWHKNIDNYNETWQNTLPPHELSKDTPNVQVRKGLDEKMEAWTPDIIFAFNKDIPNFNAKDFDGQALGQAAFGGDSWNKDFTEGTFSFTFQGEKQKISTTSTLTTIMQTDTLKIELDEEEIYDVPFTYLKHEPYSYFCRVKNNLPISKKVTIRLFMVLKELEEERGMWIEMDKFLAVLAPNAEQVIFRQDRESSVIRKPVDDYQSLADYLYKYDQIESDTAADIGSTDDPIWGRAYCMCGWSYHLLLPKGTTEGTKCSFMMMVTDGDKDHVTNQDKDCCGSMSYCSAKNAYPDAQEMGFPFNRPFENTIASTIAKQPNMAERILTIKHQTPAQV